MNKILILIAVCMGFTPQIFAQKGVGIKFDNGVIVAIKSRTIPPTSEKEISNNYEETISYNQTNISSFGREFINHEQKVTFSYGIGITENTDKKSFTVTIKAKPSMQIRSDKFDTTKYQNKSLPSYPSNIVVNDGDTIVLDILENPQTGAKVQDLIKITRNEIPNGNYFSDIVETKDFSLEDVQLNLGVFKLYINGKLIENPSRHTFQRRFIGFEFNKYGLLVLTATPEKGYEFKRNGVIDGNKMLFDIEGDKFEVISETPILGAGKKWNLWVAKMPRKYTNYQIPDFIGYVTNAQDNMAGYMPSKSDSPKANKNILIFNIPNKPKPNENKPR